MDVVTTGALHLAFVEFYTVVKPSGAIGRPEVLIVGVETSIGHGDRVIVFQVGADMFDLNAVSNLTIMTTAAAHQVGTPVEPEVKGGILLAVPGVGFEDCHVDPHGAVVTGETEQADGAWSTHFVLQRSAVVEVITTGGRGKAVPPGNAPEKSAVSLFLLLRDMAVDTG